MVYVKLICETVSLGQLVTIIETTEARVEAVLNREIHLIGAILKEKPLVIEEIPVLRKVSVEIGDSMTDHTKRKKCSTLFVTNVEENVRFHSDQVTTNQF